MAISNGVQCPQLNSGLGTSHGWLSSMWIERSDTLIHALGYNTTLFAGQSEGWYVLILVPKKLEDFETFNAVLKRGGGVTHFRKIFFKTLSPSLRSMSHIFYSDPARAVFLLKSSMDCRQLPVCKICLSKLGDLKVYQNL